MRLGRLLADPWTLGAGGFIGALAVVGLSLPVAVGVAAGVGGYAVGTAVKALTAPREEQSPGRPEPVLPPPGTEARALYERARAAVSDLAEIARTPSPGPVRDQAVSVHAQARETLDGVARIAAQTVVLHGARSRVDVDQARRDLRRLEQDPVAHEQSLTAVQSQLAVAERLEAAWRETHNRLLGAALGLESLVASMAEVVALAGGAFDDDAGARIRSLADGLAGLRQGLAEAEEHSRQALSG